MSSKNNRDKNAPACMVIAAVIVMLIAKHFILYGHEIVNVFRQIDAIEHSIDRDDFD